MPAHAVVDLSADALDLVAAGVATPSYDRAVLRRSILHIGVGGFHRAHLATYVDDLCSHGHTDWSIVGCGILPGDAVMADVLGAQDGLYSLITRGAEGAGVGIVGSIVDYIHAYPDPAAAVERIADDSTSLVSLTITEGGYPVDGSTGAYLQDSPVAGPQSAFGVLTAGLAARCDRDGSGLTVISCDNIIANGDVARAAALGEAARHGSALVDWIAHNVAFPNSMVDRITPATTDADRDWLVAETNTRDRWPVVTEPFRQWVLERRFVGEAPPFEDVGVIMTDDVEPYELTKLRLLNATHSCVAYLAALAGITYVHTALAEPSIREYVRRFLDTEAAPTVPSAPGIDIEEYKDSVIERLSNPGIGDQIQRICLDGSAKFPVFLLPTITEQLERGGPIDLGVLGLAGWCAYLGGVADDGSEIELAGDPRLDSLVDYAAASHADPKRFLQYREVFAPSLAGDPRFAASFARALRSLRTRGVRSTLDEMLRESDDLSHQRRQ